MEKILVPMSADGMVYALSEGGGYNPLSAIFELIDNSLKDEVNSSYAEISFDYDVEASPVSIYCSDDGFSMDEDELFKTYFSYGNRKKNEGKIHSLSKYGIGGKSASLYLGNKLTVFCKKQGSDKIIGGRITNGVCEGSSIPVDKLTEEDMTEEEIKKFSSLIKSDHGTLVMITDLKPRVKEFLMSRRFESQIIRPVRIAYSAYFERTGKKIIFNGKELTPLNYCGGTNKTTKESFDGIVLGTETIKISGYDDMKLVCYHCPRDIELNYDYDIPLLSKYSGLYIFRNYRCVTPEGLSGHVFSTDTHHGQGFRALLYCNGSHDELFGNTFNKTVTTDDNFDEVLINTLRPILMKYSNESVEKRRVEGRVLSVKDNKEFDASIKELLNKIIKNNKYTRKARAAQTNDKVNDDTNNNKPTSKTNKDNRKQKSFEVVGNVTSMNGGVNGRICEVFLENGKYSINLNVDHPLYNILRRGNSDINILGIMLIKISERITLDEALKEDERIAKRMSNYYEEMSESSEIILHNLFKDYSYLYDEDEDEEDVIENLDGCVGVGVPYEELEEFASQKLSEVDALSHSIH